MTQALDQPTLHLTYQSLTESESEDSDESEEESEEEQTQMESKDEKSDEQLNQADTTAALQESLTPERILRAYPNFRGEGKMLYKVRYRDSSTSKTHTTYTYDTKLPEDMRKDFHIKYTYSGKVRKRSPKKNQLSVMISKE